MASDKHKFILITLLLTAFLCYTGYLYISLPRKTSAIDEQSAAGKLVWQKYNCGACHQVYGLGGYLGPDLTNEYRFRDTSVIKLFLKDASIFTPVMPVFNMPEPEMEALLSYLKSLDASGKSDLRTFKVNQNGTIEQ